MTIESSVQSSPDPSRTPQQVVESFLSALERVDMGAALELVDDDVRWVNYPWVSSKDKGRFEKVLGAMMKDTERFEVRYNDIHERDHGVVYTDRIDIFEGGGFSMSLPIKGEFRVREGKIVEWVDRFSWLTLLADFAKSVPAILKARLGD